MAGATSVCVTCEKNVRVKEGLFCQRCKLFKHRKCEKIDAGKKIEEYVCKRCVREEMRNVQNSSGNGSEGEETEDEILDEDSEDDEETERREEEDKEEDRNRCELCEELLQEMKRLKEENESQKEIIGILKQDLEKSVKMCSEKEVEKEEDSWVSVVKNNKKGTVNKRRSVVTELRNRFEGLNEDNGNSSKSVDREGSNDQTDNGKATKKNRQVKMKKKRVLLLASSQGRYCSRILGEKLGSEYQVCGVVKPGGKFQEVVKAVDKLTEGFGKDDCVIVMAGGNDEDQVDYREGLSEGIETLLKVKERTRIIVNALLPRYDRMDLKWKVHDMNRFIHGEVNRLARNTGNIQINFAMERMERKNFTRHGLHLNYQGKQVFCDRMVKLLSDFEKREREKTIAFLGN